MLARVFWGFLTFTLCVATAAAREFTVVVYNVENLFDADGRAIYDDYQPDRYTPLHLRTKVLNIAEVLSRFDDGAGPDIILFQEIEIDHTRRSPARGELSSWLKQHAGTTVRDLLARGELSAELADVPAEGWLLKALADRGMTGYEVVAGDEGSAPHEDGNTRAIKCVTFSRFPVRAVRQFPLENARNLVEVELDVDGAKLHVFNTHWKSGASDPALEPVRVSNAQVLRSRLDELLRDDPHADVIIGGDFNSQHNQKQRYPAMARTGINDVLRSQGNELAVRGAKRDLYNLWFELPPEQRGSDTYRGEWGTLIQLIITRGLYDYRGIQYVDNSFGVGRFSGLNVDAGGAPVRWDGGGPAGAGYSDHLPIYARFRTVHDNRVDRWISLTRPSQTESDPSVRRVSYDHVDPAATAIDLQSLPADVRLRDGSWSGKLFRVEGESVPDRHPRVRVRGEEYEVYGVDDATRDRLYTQRESGRLQFYGELGTFKGRWQFVVRSPSWVLSSVANVGGKSSNPR